MISIISGTNREQSVSKMIAHHYQQLLQGKQVESKIIDLAELPKDFTYSALYNNEGMDSRFNQYRQTIEDSQKYVFIVPEYNGSFPGVLKAFIDGLKYPESFQNKKCALVGIASSPQGGSLALSHLTDIFNHLGMHVLAMKPKLAQIHHYMDNQGINRQLYLDLLEEQAAKIINF